MLAYRLYPFIRRFIKPHNMTLCKTMFTSVNLNVSNIAGSSIRHKKCQFILARRILTHARYCFTFGRNTAYLHIFKKWQWLFLSTHFTPQSYNISCALPKPVQ